MRPSSTERSRVFWREREGALELGARFGDPAELLQQVAAHGREQVVVAQGRLAREAVDESAAPAPARRPSPTATARLSSTTGDGAIWASPS